jgi:hypothetical protein
MLDNMKSKKTDHKALTYSGSRVILIFRNTPVSFGEGARSRFERVGSCFFNRHVVFYWKRKAHDNDRTLLDKP